MTTAEQVPLGIPPITRHRPFMAKIVHRYPLTRPGTSKETFHISLGIEGASIECKAGDSLAIFGQNHPDLVAEILSRIGATGIEPVHVPRTGELLCLRDFFLFRVNLARVNASLLCALSAAHPSLSSLLDTPDRIQEYTRTYDLLDLFRAFRNISLDPATIVSHLSPLLPRFYSMASSLLHSPHHIDLTVAWTTFLRNGEQRYGVASHFLCHLARVAETDIPIYVQPTSHFRLPEDPSRSLIMIGAGTGIAPYRAFLQERALQGATGKHWLIFGTRTREHEFFYQDFWEEYARKHSLRLDTAFSRDQPEKLYVQHRLWEHRQELWAWLEEGATLYLCGSADPMAKDVESTLIRLFADQGGYTEERARHHLQHLRKQKRFLADVY